MTSFKWWVAVLFILGCSYKSPEKSSAEWAKSREGFDIYKSSVIFAHTEGYQAEGWLAKAALNVEVCLVRTFGWRQMEPGISFQMQLAENTTGDASKWETLRTTPSGCVEVVKMITYPYAEKSPHYLRNYVLVRGMDGELRDLVRSQAIYLDPWNRMTLTEWNEEQNGFPQPGLSGPLHVRFPSVTLRKTLTREIGVERSLDLHFCFPYSLTFEPQLVRVKQLNAHAPDRPSWEGTRYLIRGALIAPALLGAFETIGVSDNNGQVSAPIALPVALNDLRWFEARPRLVLDIIPLSNTDNTPEGESLSIAFDARAEQYDYTTQVSRVTAASILESEGKDFVEMPHAEDPPSSIGSPSLRIFVKTSSVVSSTFDDLLTSMDVEGELKRIDIDQDGIPDAKVTHEELSRVVLSKDLDPGFLRHFGFLYSHEDSTFPGSETKHKSEFDQFNADPSSFVAWQRFVYVDRVDPEPTHVGSDYDVFNVQATMTKGGGEYSGRTGGERSAVSDERGDNRQVGFSSFGVGRTWYWTYQGREERYLIREKAQRQEESSQSVFSRISYFYVDHLKLTFTGDFRRCLLLRFKPSRAGHAGTNNFLLCGKTPDPVTESYYYVTDEYRSNVFSLLDFRDLHERQMLKIFRGEQGIADFRKIIENSSLNLEFLPARVSSNFQSMKEKLVDSFREVNALPGVLDMERSPEMTVVAPALPGLIHQLSRLLGRSPQVENEELLAYFTLAQEKPEVVFGTPEGRQRFQDLSSHILHAITPDGRRSYFTVLAEIYYTMDVTKFKSEAQWLYQAARDLEAETKVSE